jgi:hypothetical protein
MRRAAFFSIFSLVFSLGGAARADDGAPSPAPESKWPKVHLDSTKAGAALFRRDESKKLIDKRGSVDDVWEFVCYAPCDKRVDPDAVYRVLGATIPPSDAFVLGSEDVTLKVDAGSTRTQALARGTGGLGLASVIASGVFFVAEGATDSENKEDSMRVLGQVFLIGGLTLTITSIILDSIGSTSVRSETTQAGEKNETVRRGPSGVKLTPFGFVF